jgi:hypothetical protein
MKTLYLYGSYPKNKILIEILRMRCIKLAWMDGWMDFGGWSPERLLHAGLNTGLMCNPGREVRIKGFWMEM